MKKKIHNSSIFLIFLVSIFSSSCVNNENNIESDAIKEFDNNRPQMVDVIDYVKGKYYYLDSIKKLNSLQFILSDISYQKGTIFTDEQVFKKLESTNIYDVSFVKNSLCIDKFTFDEVRFKLKIKNANYQYYYVYEFCPLNNENIDGPNFKSIALDRNWSLQIEKN
ncbi:MAG: hypothetical protein ABI091_15090 [Ferruginibacter sp.]